MDEQRRLRISFQASCTPFSFATTIFRFSTSLCLMRLLVELQGDVCTLYNPTFCCFRTLPTPPHVRSYSSQRCTTQNKRMVRCLRTRRIAEKREIVLLSLPTVSQSVRRYDSFARKQYFQKNFIHQDPCIHAVQLFHTLAPASSLA